jgi:hypothetical protein
MRFDPYIREPKVLSIRLYAKHKVRRAILSIDLADPGNIFWEGAA